MARTVPVFHKKLALSLSIALILSGCSVKPQQLTHQETLTQAKTDMTTLLLQAEPVLTPVDLDQAIARAIKHNRERKLQTLEAVLEQGQLDLGNFDMLPKLTANAGYSQRSNYAASASTTFENGEPAPLSSSPSYSVSQDKSQTSGNIAFTWDVLDFGLSYVRAKQQADRYLVAKERERKVIHNIVQDVRNSYYRAVSSERLLGKIEPLIEQAQAALNDAQKIELAQAKSPIDALNYQRELLEILRTLQALRQDLITAKTELSVLMGLKPGQKFTLADVNNANFKVPELKIDIDTMERTALVKRPELLESQYQKRISVEETRAAMLSLLPGISLNAGAYYDDTKYLKNNEWTGFGTQVSWNLLNVFRIGSINKITQLKKDFAEEQALATSMAVLSQVHIADIRYEEAEKSYELADRYLTVSKRISEQMRASHQLQQTGELELIRENLNTLLAELRRDVAYADLQNSFGRIFVSMGLDLVPEGFGQKSVDELSKDIGQSFNRWEDGKLDLVTLQSPATAPQPDVNKVSSKTGKE